VVLSTGNSFASLEVASSGPDRATLVTPSVKEFCVSTPSPLLLSKYRACTRIERNQAFLGDRQKWQFAVCYGTVALSVCLSVCNVYFARGAVAQYYDEYVCLSVVEDISGTTRDLCHFLCMLPMSVARSFSSMLTIGRIAYRREKVFFAIENALSVGKGDGSAQHGRSK